MTLEEIRRLEQQSGIRIPKIGPDEWTTLGIMRAKELAERNAMPRAVQPTPMVDTGASRFDMPHKQPRPVPDGQWHPAYEEPSTRKYDDDQLQKEFGERENMLRQARVKNMEQEIQSKRVPPLDDPKTPIKTGKNKQGKKEWDGKPHEGNRWKPDISLNEYGLPRGVFGARDEQGRQTHRGLLGGISGWAKDFFNDPSRVALTQAGLTAMNPNSYYDKEGFSSGLGGLNKAIGAGVKTYQDLMNPIGGQRLSEFQRLLVQRDTLMETNPQSPNLPFINDRIKYLSTMQDPNNIRTFDRVKNMSLQDQELFFNTIRGPKTINQGGYTGVLNPTDPTELAVKIPKIPPPETLPPFKEQVAEQSAIGKGRGEDIAGAISKLPDMEVEYRTLTELSDKLIKHAGFEDLIGATYKPWFRHMHGTDAADADSIRKQLEGKVFMQAYQTLKGGGQITEIEGQQAKEALARMNIGLSEVEYKQAMAEFLSAYKRGMAKMRRVAGQRRTTGTNNDPLGIRN